MKLNTIRKIVTPFMVIPLAMIGVVNVFPKLPWESSGVESLFLVICIPIVILNFFAWFHPEFFQPFLPPNEKPEQVNQEKLAVWLSGAGSFIAFILLGVGMVSGINRVSAVSSFAPTETQLAGEFDSPAFSPLPSKNSDPNTNVAATPTRTPEIAQVPITGEENAILADEQTRISTLEYFTPTVTFTPTITNTPTVTPTFTRTPDPIFSASSPMTAGIYDASDPKVIRVGDWVSQENVNAHQENLIISNTAGNYVAFSFTGRQMRLGYQANANAGDLTVKIDESEVTITQLVGNAWFSPTFEPGTHFVILTHEKGKTVNLDYIEISQ